MELLEIYQNRNFNGVNSILKAPKISFEIFPPKDGNISNLFEQVRILKKYKPVLISLTYGANGGTRDLSLELLRSLIDLEFNVMPHFTCIGATKELIEHYIVQIENMGIENILALRGDKSADMEGLTVSEFSYANELIDFIHLNSTLSIGVAGYPEGHIEAESIYKDVENLKKKVESGASAIFTQLFFDNDKFYSYLDLLEKSGIKLPVIPGIMPIRSLKQIERMVEITHVKIPGKLRQDLERFPDDAKKIGTEYSIKQCQDLIDSGVDALHFFTLNKADHVIEILDNIL